MEKSSFGQQLRKYRRQCRDPLRGGLVTQDRFGELLGEELGDAGYTGAAVSEWERDRSKINADNRMVLVSLVSVLHKHGPLDAPEDANELLRAGNYRALDEAEFAQIFPDLAEKLVQENRENQPPSPITPTSPQTITKKRRKQRILLDKVNNFWVKGVLECSTQNAMLLELEQQRCDSVVDQPWQNLVGMDIPQTSTPSTLENTLNIFYESDRALLILGAPGAGKTITLIELARQLIAQAEIDETQPIPVILNLASWTETRLPLVDWILVELSAKYQIPNKLGREWLNDDDLLLLLDGLDTVDHHYRAACVITINQFRQTNGLTGLVVCSRSNAYESLDVRLKLGGAMLLQPLTPSQINAYLLATGPTLQPLHKAVQADNVLHEMAQSPLALNVMTHAFSRTITKANGSNWREYLAFSTGGTDSDTETIIHHWLFDAYIDQMFQRQGLVEKYPKNKTVVWLAWLAQQMLQHNQSVFLIEQIQPSWLPSLNWQRLYLFLSRLLDGFMGGILMWLLLLLFQQVVPAFTELKI